MKYNNILITACNSQYVKACLTLISHVQQFPVYDKIDQIIVYNLGMTQEQIDYLNSCEKVTVQFFGKDTLTFFPGYLDPKTYAWKMYAIYQGQFLANNCVFYLDAGVAPIRDFSCVYNNIESDGIFLIGSLHKIGEHITDDCKDYMNVQDCELEHEAISAAIQGYRVNSWAVENYINLGFEISKEPKAICGPKYGPKPHRHDQTIYSLLAHRLGKATFHDVYKYAGWLNPNMHPEQIFWHHRRNYINFNKLRKRI